MKQITILLLAIFSRINSQDFFPLQAGNNWTYCGSTDTLHKRTYLIKDSVSIGDRKYFLYGINNFNKDTIRKDLYGNIWKLQGGKDILWFDFTRDSGDVYYFHDFDDTFTVTVSKYLSTQTYIGNYTNCVCLFFDIPHAVDDEIRYTFAPGIGLVKTRGAWIDDLLYSAVINNVLVHVSNNRGTAPGLFLLSQNYPNPFNSTTLINYQLPSSGFVSLKVFDLMGRELETLVDKEQAPGTYKVIFDASRLMSGVYFYSIQSNRHRDVKKMLLIR